jgi:hypothetical protein
MSLFVMLASGSPQKLALDMPKRAVMSRPTLSKAILDFLPITLNESSVNTTVLQDLALVSFCPVPRFGAGKKAK